ncbi:MAG: nicotinate phosphoribosyltransferase [Jaaginema sp. PMC 1079.18]|nr:nicotinate phosphoribosyltransferase [Jaaginema sp. PMC 1080.18]MEC4850083.1 nicotinate phosphoribosyltransferase [Jaaginema sp. PMC 1079.18]MEC4867564.1 nicotinate phosphoribosyltransferase [Jaaginema sp. PMC 1078.18]
MIDQKQALAIYPEEYSLLTDLYQLTMIACYQGENLAYRPASFEMFARKLPEGFGYIVAMGLTQVLNYLENLHFSEAQIEALQATGIFDKAPPDFWKMLATGRFTGDVWAVPEGTAIFPNEPFLRIDAPLWQAQLVETFVLNTINYQSLIATRAARLRDVAGKEARLLEFGTRRAFSPQGALWAVRAALAGGLDATSNVIGALKLGQKPVGTMAHALVMAIGATEGGEDEAFTAFQRYFPAASLLIDTYDTVEAAQRLAKQVEAGQRQVTGVRLDSGDLATLSQKVRELLPDIAIFASGDIDEEEIERLQAAGASIDGYGLGTKLVTGKPINGVYKLVQIDDIPTLKQSSSKATYPGRKQVFRYPNRDCLALAEETPPEGAQALLKRVMQEGKRLIDIESIEQIRDRVSQSVAQLPPATRRIHNPESVTVAISPALADLTAKVKARIHSVV